MFKAKMADAKFLKDMMGAISILVDEATFDLTPEGIKAGTHTDRWEQMVARAGDRLGNRQAQG